MKQIRIGTRESALAMAQTQLISAQIQAAEPHCSIELVPMKTEGDRILHRTLEEIGGKGLFVKELDVALLEGKIDLAVHSLKDLPMDLTSGLTIAAYSARGDARDVLVLPAGTAGFSGQGCVGSSSARRRMQVQQLFPATAVRPVRGNVLTRLQKLDAGEYDALILAHAGLSRLGLSQRISRVFSPEEMVPAAGQGILAVVGRSGEAYDFLDKVEHPASRACAIAERAFVRGLDGGCTEPIGAYGEVQGQELKLLGFYSDGERSVSGSLVGSIHQAQQCGERLAKELRGRL